MNLEKVSRDDWIVGGAALLLVIDLLAFPWWSVSLGPITVTGAATSAPDGWLGVLAFLTALALVADLALERLSPQTQLPSIQGSRTMTRFVLAVATAVLLALKFLFNIHFSYFGFGFYLAVVLSAALVYLTLQARSGTA
jgi:hypothetical protein